MNVVVVIVGDLCLLFVHGLVIFPFKMEIGRSYKSVWKASLHRDGKSR